MKSSEKQIDKVDQLFKNKLEDHTIAPSENAWARVEAELSKKNKLWIVSTLTTQKVAWRLAAAVLLMGALLSVVYWSQTGGSEKVLAKKTQAPHESKKEVAQTPQTPKDNVASASQNKREVKPKENLNRAENNVSATKKEVAQEKQPSESRKKIIEIESQLAQNSFKLDRVESNQEANKEEKIKGEATPTAQVASSKQKPIKLEFTLEPLPSEETVATANEAKSTGIKKVLNLAREMKQGEGLSSLREKKDELLANNFLTKRERNQ